MKAAILGCTGYTGQILLRLLAKHPEITEIYPVSSSQVGADLLEKDPGLSKTLVKKLVSGTKLLDIQDAVAAKPEVVFAALPHLKSATVCEPFFNKAVLIDLSADFRIKDNAKFLKAYGLEPPRPDLLEKAVYGLVEHNREAIKTADIIANPGCYPTASLLPLLPLAKRGFLKGDIIINALSGISGAGKKASDNNLYCTRTENLNAYAPAKSHRHQTEIQDQLERLGLNLNSGAQTENPELDVFFTPHLVPVKQGMEVTSTVVLKPGISDEAIAEAYAEDYSQEAFVQVSSNLPQSAQVRLSNRCDLSWYREKDRIFLFSVLDNLLKGASGQAVQNMNVRFGFEETSGLELSGEIL